MTSRAQTQGSKGKGHIKGVGVWCNTCGTYMHVRCSGLPDHYEGFICQYCSEVQPAPPEPPNNPEYNSSSDPTVVPNTFEQPDHPTLPNDTIP